MTNIETRTLTARDWPVIKELFGPRGACGGCWCMYWRVPQGGKYWQAQKGDGNRRSFKKLVEAGRVSGTLAFADGAPVGWCSAAPKADFAYFARSRVLAHDSPPGTWAVTCFYIPTKWRGRGVATHLLEAAKTLGRDAGASCLEAYPVVPKSAGSSVPAAFAWTGVPRLYEACGFTLAPDVNGPRPVYRFDLR